MEYEIDELIFDSSSTEKTLVGIGVLLSLFEDDTDGLDLYPGVFSQSYLEYGVLAATASLLSTFKNPLEFLLEIQETKFSTTEKFFEKSYSNVVRTMLSGGSPIVPPVQHSIEGIEWEALLNLPRVLFYDFNQKAGSHSINVLKKLREKIIFTQASNGQL